MEGGESVSPDPSGREAQADHDQHDEHEHAHNDAPIPPQTNIEEPIMIEPFEEAQGDAPMQDDVTYSPTHPCRDAIQYIKKYIRPAYAYLHSDARPDRETAVSRSGRTDVKNDDIHICIYIYIYICACIDMHV